MSFPTQQPAVGHGARPQLRREWLKCAESPAYFAVHYLHLYAVSASPAEGIEDAGWIPFHLWPAQAQALDLMRTQRRLVILKARQLGLTWLALAYALWLLVFAAPATVLLFSLREQESAEMLARLKGMYRRLPAWLRARDLAQDSRTAFELSTGSRALAFSTRAGRSYTGSLAIVDEADYIPNLDLFLNGVKPTIDGGGQLFLISTCDKRRPVSVFKNLFRAAEDGAPAGNAPTDNAAALHAGALHAGGYARLFLPWHAHPGRDAAWHTRTRAEMHAQRGTHDDFLAEYPATPEEALAPAQQDRRIPLDWLQACLRSADPLQTPLGAPAIPALTLYVPPRPGRAYALGADPAEGSPRSDDSVAIAVDAATGEECAVIAGRIEPTQFAGYVAQLAAWYHDAPILPERNNHGHTVIAALHDAGCRVLCGHDGKAGWLSSAKGKTLLYNGLADAVRHRDCVIHNAETAGQIASIEASTLRAPVGLHDDYADAFALALMATVDPHARAVASQVARAVDPLQGVDEEGW